MKTLYEILEVSETASKEVIEKAYKVLAKKYHPDLQAPENKANAENQMKKINEAYDILSDETKRKEYDLNIERKRQEERQKEAQNTQRENSYVNYNQMYNNMYQNPQPQNYTAPQEDYDFRQQARRRYEEE